MPETPKGQDEARRALIADWIETCLTRHPNDILRRPLFDRDTDWRIILSALRAPSLDRGAEEMRDIIAAWHDDLALDRDQRASKIVVNTFGRDRLQYEATIHRDCARAVRSMPLPVPADLNEGGGK